MFVAIGATWVVPALRMNLGSLSTDPSTQRVMGLVNSFKMVGWTSLALSLIWGARLAMHGSQYRNNCCALEASVESYLSQLSTPPPAAMPPPPRWAVASRSLLGPGDNPTGFGRNQATSTPAPKPQRTWPKDLSEAVSDHGTACRVLEANPPEVLAPPILGIAGTLALFLAVLLVPGFAKLFWRHTVEETGSFLYARAFRGYWTASGNAVVEVLPDGAAAAAAAPPAATPAFDAIDAEQSEERKVAVQDMTTVVSIVVVPGTSRESVEDRLFLARVVPE